MILLNAILERLTDRSEGILKTQLYASATERLRLLPTNAKHAGADLLGTGDPFAHDLSSSPPIAARASPASRSKDEIDAIGK